MEEKGRGAGGERVRVGVGAESSAGEKKGGQGPNHATVCSAGAAWAADSIVCPIAAVPHLDGDAAVVLVVVVVDRRGGEPPSRRLGQSRAEPNRGGGRPGDPFISRARTVGG